jgi:predicted dehydrogenase
MNQDLRWGILAAGKIAHQVVSDFQRAGLSVHAAAARDLGKAQEFAKKFNLAKAYDSFVELVNDPMVDIVYVASLNHLHVEHALLAIEAGKHVLIEKPFSTTAEGAQRVVDAAANKGVFVMEAMWSRFLPSMQRVSEIIKSGVIGEVRTIYADHDQWLPESKAARLHFAEWGGGSLLDLGIYPISFAFFLLGQPSKITATATLSQRKIDLQTSVIFDYPQGQQALLHSSVEVAGPVRAAVVATGGRIEMQKSFYEQCEFSVFDLEGNLLEHYADKIEGRGMHFQALEVERCIRAGLSSSPILSGAESVRIMQALDEIRLQTGIENSGD